MFDDWAMTPARVSLRSSCGNQSWMTRSPLLQLTRHQQPCLVGDLARVDQAAEGEHLLDRPGLVGAGHGQRVAVALRRGRRVARVVRRVVGQSEELAGLAVHHDREAGVTAGAEDRLPEHPLGVPLQVLVDRRVQVGAVVGRCHRAVAERDAVTGSDLVGLGAVRPGELLVEAELETRERTVGAHEAHQVGRHVVVGVRPQRVVARGQPFVPRLGGLVDHPDRLVGRHAPRDVGEPGVLLAQRVQGVEVVDRQPLGQEASELRCHRTCLQRVGHHHPAGHGLGEGAAVAVEDVAALGGKLHRHRATGRGRERRVLRRLHALQLDQARTEERQHQCDEEEARAEAQRRRASARQLPPAPRRRAGSRVPAGGPAAGAAAGAGGGQRARPQCP